MIKVRRDFRQGLECAFIGQGTMGYLTEYNGRSNRVQSSVDNLWDWSWLFR